MPRVVRNFWIDLDVDGRANSIGTGPRQGGGGFSCTILVREEGSISDKSLRIRGVNTQDNNNVLSVELMDGSRVVKEITLEVPRDEVKEPKKKAEVVLEPAEPEKEPTPPPSRDEAFWKITEGSDA